MKLTIPNQIDPTGFSDGDKMFTSMMYLIAAKYGYEHWYNMNSGDFKKIVFDENATNPNLFGPRTEILREHFDFAKIDHYNYLVRFKNVKSKSRNGEVGVAVTEISKLRCIKIWCYLMGQWFGGNEIINETDTLIQYDTNRRSAGYLEFKNFLVG